MIMSVRTRLVVCRERTLKGRAKPRSSSAADARLTRLLTQRHTSLALDSPGSIDLCQIEHNFILRPAVRGTSSVIRQDEGDALLLQLRKGERFKGERIAKRFNAERNQMLSEVGVQLRCWRMTRRQGDPLRKPQGNCEEGYMSSFGSC